jgi:hypothetical protein
MYELSRAVDSILQASDENDLINSVGQFVEQFIQADAASRDFAAHRILPGFCINLLDIGETLARPQP